MNPRAWDADFDREFFSPEEIRESDGRVERMQKEIDMEKVIRPVQGYEGHYEVDAAGNVYSVKRGRNLLVKRINPSGYEVVTLCKNGVQKTMRVHRIVASAFIPNPDNLPIINHKDENRINNSVENLEWCTPRYNLMYGGARERASNKMRGRKHTDMHNEKISKSVAKYYSTHESKLKNRPTNRRKAVVLQNIETGIEISFPSVTEAGIYVGDKSGSNVCRAIKRGSTVCGHYARYEG